MTLMDLIKSHNKICWYPSTGADFRGLLYLSEYYSTWKNVPIDKDQHPDLFIFTDICPEDIIWGGEQGTTNISYINSGKYRNLKTLYNSCFRNKTLITVNGEVKLIERLNLPVIRELYTLSISDNYGCVFYMNVHVHSKRFGDYDVDCVYILVDNSRFAFDYLVKNKINIDYIIRVRDGSGFGGSRVQGEWLLKLIRPLNVKYFVSNPVCKNSFGYIPEEYFEYFSDYADILEDTTVVPLDEIHWVPGTMWSGDELSNILGKRDVYWYKVLQNM